MAPELTALVAATGLHAGFQLTVTLVVYPALARLGPDVWDDGHRAHSRAIAPLVALVYGALAAACGWALAARPGDPWTLASLAMVGIAVLLTALVAAPTHGRLSGGPEPALLRRLLRADRGRTAAAVLALLAALAAVAAD